MTMVCGWEVMSSIQRQVISRRAGTRYRRLAAVEGLRMFPR
jgi:hypothetical protein